MFYVITKKRLVQSCFLGFGFLLAFYGIWHGMMMRAVAASATVTEEKRYIAVVIDDFGYHGEGTEEMLALDIPITAAVMPFSPQSGEDAKQVQEAGKEAIIHMPMESLTGKKSWVGDKGVFRTMTDEEIKKRVQEALAVVPNAVGINNHMGSAIMEDARCLETVIATADQNGLIFVDSMTTPKSQTKPICEKLGISYLKRDVFLDSTNDINKVKQQLQKAQEIALQKGYAVVIGHVGPEGGVITAKALAELAPEMEKNGIEFVTVSQMKEVVVAKEGKKKEAQETGKR